MNNSEYERIFQLKRGMDSRDMPETAAMDNALGRSVAEVFELVERDDEAKMRLLNPARPPGNQLEPLNWRKPLDRPGNPGENCTIAQQCVYVGARILKHLRPRTVKVLQHLMDKDAELAWGRLRFNTGLEPVRRQYPDPTLLLACTKARPDIVQAMLNHPSADYYLPTWASKTDTPIFGNRLWDTIFHTVKFNDGPALEHDRNNPGAMEDRRECIELLKAEHRRRHGVEQRAFEWVMKFRLSRLMRADRQVSRLCADFITYSETQATGTRQTAR